VAQSVQVIARVAAGELVVLISDAGTPGISDPGSRVVAAVIEAGYRVTTAPGPSAVIAALSVSGLSTDRFVMEGFLSRKSGERAKRYDQWTLEERTIVFYESPQRVTSVLKELVERFPDRRVALARELTKLHEEVIRGTVRDVWKELSQREILGEVVVVLEGASAPPPIDTEIIVAALVEQMGEGVSTRDAVEYVSATWGVAHRDVYQLAIIARKDGPTK
jgi:16S rRNA (cytidine1402-2'-O)-methyltransferase